jgi:serpin B
MKCALLSFVLFVPLLAGAEPVDTGDVVSAINALGLDLYRVQPGDGNLLLSPYSIQNALAMAYAGAAGDTRTEMQRVLHYPADDTAIHGGFAELARELEQIVRDSAERAEKIKIESGKPAKYIQLVLANRLFVQRGYELRAPFLELVKDDYGAEPELLDFRDAAEQARVTINQWAEDNTKGRIRDVIPPGGVSTVTRLVLTNAVYLFAPWDKPFDTHWTEPLPFFIHTENGLSVPTMQKGGQFGYEHHVGFIALSLPYIGGGMQLLILLPDKRDGLPALERRITPELLAECAILPRHLIILHLPKFKLEPSSIALSAQLHQLGMKIAFDEPHGSANFARMAPRKPDDYLALSNLFHKAYLEVAESGTEAAAVTTVTTFSTGRIASPTKPIEVRVDHPFIFAIQHVPSGECLFLGRVTDPRGKG